MKAVDTDGLATWTSEAIAMTGVTSPTLEMDLYESKYDGSEGYSVYVSYDGVNFSEVASATGGFNTDNISVNLSTCSKRQQCSFLCSPSKLNN